MGSEETSIEFSVCAGMVAGAAARLEKLLRCKKCQQELKGEKAPLFGLWRACWDNSPAKQ
jgi:hypothetical protein